MILSFELTMPNVGSWNGKWSGQDAKYYVINKLSKRWFNKQEHLKDLRANGRDSWYYNFGDGWGANVTAEIIEGAEATKRRKMSKGFSGYEWMIDEIMKHGRILEREERQELRKQRNEKIGGINVIYTP